MEKSLIENRDAGLVDGIKLPLDISHPLREWIVAGLQLGEAFAVAVENEVGVCHEYLHISRFLSTIEKCYQGFDLSTKFEREFVAVIMPGKKLR